MRFKQIMIQSYAKNKVSGVYEFICENAHSINLLTDDGYPNDDDTDWIHGSNLHFEVSLRFNKHLKNEFMTLWKETFTDCV